MPIAEKHAKIERDKIRYDKGRNDVLRSARPTHCTTLEMYFDLHPGLSFANRNR